MSEDLLKEADELAGDSRPAGRRKGGKFPVKPVTLGLLLALLAVFGFRTARDITLQPEPSYRALLPDSASIAESAILLEYHVASNGSFPDGFKDHVESTDGISLTVNPDGSFTYSEGDFTHRSAPGLLAPGGEE